MLYTEFIKRNLTTTLNSCPPKFSRLLSSGFRPPAAET